MTGSNRAAMSSKKGGNPLVIYRLIENDAIDAADRVLQLYSTFLHYHPLNFTFVRDILAYFYGHLPGKLILRILNVLDIKKVIMVFFRFQFPCLSVLITMSWYCPFCVNWLFFFRSPFTSHSLNISMAQMLQRLLHWSTLPPFYWASSIMSFLLFIA